MAKGGKEKKGAAPAPSPAERKIKKKPQNKGKAPVSRPPPPVSNTDGVNASGASKSRDSEKGIKGFIFLCSSKTKPECYRRRLFGLPGGKLDLVEKIKKGATLFLFDFELKLLNGVYEAASNGGMNLEASAFGGKFPAQVRFKIKKDCFPLPEASFKQAMKENYHMGKFNPELSFQQVQNLQSLFQPITVEERNLPPPAEEHYRFGHHHSPPPLDTRSRYESMVPHLPHDPYIPTHCVTRPPPVESQQFLAARLPSQTGAYHPAAAGLPPPHDAYYQPAVMTDLPPRDGAYYQPVTGVPPPNDVLPAAGLYHRADPRIYYPENVADRYRAALQKIPKEQPPNPVWDYRSLRARGGELAPVYEDWNWADAGSLRRPIFGGGDVPKLTVSSLYSLAGAVPAYR